MKSKVYFDYKKVFAVVSWLVIIAFFSLKPRSISEGYLFFNNEDKIGHMLIYGILAFLILLCIGNKNKALAKAILFSSTYGLLMEILQKVCTQDRSFDYYDIIANIFGALLGTILTYRLVVSKLH